MKKFLAFLFLAIPAGFAAERPNIVLVMADDLGWSDIGCYGGEIPTPAIDSLAENGIRFTQFYNNAVCGPTRASLLTGLYPQQIGHAGNHWNQPKDFSKCVTLGEVLQTAGYQTMMVGKWQGRDPATERGFDRFFGPRCQAKISYFHEVQGNPFYLNGERWKLPDDGSFFMTDAFGDYAVKFTEEAVKNDAPFFLYLAYIAPHWPLHAPEDQVAPHRDRYREKGWNHWRQVRFQRQREMGLISKQWRLGPKAAAFADWKDAPNQDWQTERMAVYSAQVAAVDGASAGVLETVRKAGKENNTLFLFLSDNGAAPNMGTNPSAGGFGFEPGKDNSKWRLDGVPIRPGSGPDNMPGPHDTFAAYGIAWATTGNTPLAKQQIFSLRRRDSHPAGGVLASRSRSQDAGRSRKRDRTRHRFHADVLRGRRGRIPVRIRRPEATPHGGRQPAPVFQEEPRKNHEILCWSAPQTRQSERENGNWSIRSEASRAALRSGGRRHGNDRPGHSPSRNCRGSSGGLEILGTPRDDEGLNEIRKPRAAHSRFSILTFFTGFFSPGFFFSIFDSSAFFSKRDQLTNRLPELVFQAETPAHSEAQSLQIFEPLEALKIRFGDLPDNEVEGFRDARCFPKHPFRRHR